MKFLKKNENMERYVDTIFTVVNAAKADKEGINGTAGCLADENGVLLTYDCVYEIERQIRPIQRASYASSPSGNSDYVDAVSRFVLEDRVTNHHAAIATPGGTGAISTAVRTCLQEGDTILYPEISWGNYKVIAAENGLNVLTYDVYDLKDLFSKIDQIPDKVFLVINSPCENPLGHAYGLDEWQKIMDKLNHLDREVVLLCDIAYIDYANNDPKAYFKLFNELSDQILVEDRAELRIPGHEAAQVKSAGQQEKSGESGGDDRRNRQIQGENVLHFLHQVLAHVFPAQNL